MSMRCDECDVRLGNEFYMVNAIIKDSERGRVAISLSFGGLCDSEFSKIEKTKVHQTPTELGLVGYLIQEAREIEEGNHEPHPGTHHSYEVIREIGYVGGGIFYQLFPRTARSLVGSNTWLKFPFKDGEHYRRAWWVHDLVKRLKLSNVEDILNYGGNQNG